MYFSVLRCKTEEHMLEIIAALFLHHHIIHADYTEQGRKLDKRCCGVVHFISTKPLSLFLHTYLQQ